MIAVLDERGHIDETATAATDGVSARTLPRDGRDQHAGWRICRRWLPRRTPVRSPTNSSLALAQLADRATTPEWAERAPHTAPATSNAKSATAHQAHA